MNLCLSGAQSCSAPPAEPSRLELSSSLLQCGFFPHRSGETAAPPPRKPPAVGNPKLLQDWARFASGGLTTLPHCYGSSPSGGAGVPLECDTPQQLASTSGPTGNRSAWAVEGAGCCPECPGPRRAGCQGSASSWRRDPQTSFLLPASGLSPPGRLVLFCC